MGHRQAVYDQDAIPVWYGQCLGASSVPAVQPQRGADKPLFFLFDFFEVAAYAADMIHSRFVSLAREVIQKELVYESNHR